MKAETGVSRSPPSNFDRESGFRIPAREIERLWKSGGIEASVGMESRLSGGCVPTNAWQQFSYARLTIVAVTG